jgi:hypothetical protein
MMLGQCSRIVHLISQLLFHEPELQGDLLPLLRYVVSLMGPDYVNFGHYFAMERLMSQRGIDDPEYKSDLGVSIL